MGTNKRAVLCFTFSSLLCAVCALATSQDSPASDGSAEDEISQRAALPAGYRGITLGMSVDDTEEALKNDASFGYRGERDVSMLPDPNRSLIETDTATTAPYSFLERCFFQFNDGKLYVITLNLRPSKVDYHSVFVALTEKYGEPDSLSPQKCEWSDDSVIMTLERPLTLKYTDKAVFDELANASSAEATAEENSKEDFLQGL